MPAITPRTAEVVIYQGDDLSNLAHLRHALDVAQRTAALEVATMGGNEQVAAARDAYEKAVDEAAERAVTVVLQAVGVRKFRELRADHPPRRVPVEGENGKTEEHPDDAGLEVNTSTMPWVLLPLAIIEPKMHPVEAEQFLEALSDGDFERLWQTAYYLNALPGSDPKAEMQSGAFLT